MFQYSYIIQLLQLCGILSEGESVHYVLHFSTVFQLNEDTGGPIWRSLCSEATFRLWKRVYWDLISQPHESIPNISAMQPLLRKSTDWEDPWFILTYQIQCNMYTWFSSSSSLSRPISCFSSMAVIDRVPRDSNRPIRWPVTKIKWKKGQ